MRKEEEEEEEERGVDDAVVESEVRGVGGVGLDCGIQSRGNEWGSAGRAMVRMLLVAYPV